MCEAADAVIRPYEPRDWPRLMEIHDRARRDELALAGLSDAFVPLAQAAVSECLFDDTVIVAESGGRVAAFAATDGDELAWLYVDPDLAGRGFGSALVRYVIDRHAGQALHLEVLAGNEPARRLYEKFGFQTVETATGRMPGNERFAVTVLCMERAARR